MGLGGRMDCCGQCVKYSMFISNFIIFIGGAIVFGLGIWTLVDKNFINELLGTNLFSGAVYVLIATSALVCLLSFFGCIGAAKEYKCMLLTYFLLYFLLFAVLFLGCILGYAFRGRVTESLRDQLYEALTQYGRRRMMTISWDITQEELQCCGVDSFTDWHDQIPDSCCLDEYGGRKRPCQQLQTSLTIFQSGCFEAVTRELLRNAGVLGGAGMGLAFAMIPGIVLAYYMLTTL
ncbi:tetraspanin-4 isoform X2 [Topomyia yanbarensis]|uniref:tetraspanin-4 isoform X2 n=1 Tax=Topomyia yanbarensis TaxID=2498891 RepID=UPI00273CA4CD|nr:tetraspanin-4 isoform X2 [Topomyia yanbarensis]